MTTDMYILHGHIPVRCERMQQWGEWFETHFEDRVVAQTWIPWTEDNNILVSTVFLGIDHNFCMTGEPILFETMVFGGEHNGWCRRYSTWEEAEQGHAITVAAIREGEEPEPLRFARAQSR